MPLYKTNALLVDCNFNLINTYFFVIPNAIIMNIKSSKLKIFGEITLGLPHETLLSFFSSCSKLS